MEKNIKFCFNYEVFKDKKNCKYEELDETIKHKISSNYAVKKLWEKSRIWAFLSCSWMIVHHSMTAYKAQNFYSKIWSTQRS